MKKQIEFYPYSQAEITGVNDDGSVVCNLYGMIDGVEYRDGNVSFPADSPILRLTPDEIGQIG